MSGSSQRCAYCPKLRATNLASAMLDDKLISLSLQCKYLLRRNDVYPLRHEVV